MTDDVARGQEPVEQAHAFSDEMVELCREHRIDVALMQSSHDLDELLDLVIDEYERNPPRDLKQLLAFTRRAAILEERAAAEAERAELLERLGALAHRINNPLTSLVGRAQILGLKKGIDPQVDKAAQVIEDSAKRIAAHIRELADLVREAKGAAR
jgi:signal transduction histidine kinase